MKCISLWQPWATLIAIGAKRIETRAWHTDYRGPLLIHAAKKWGPELAKLFASDPFFGPLDKAGYWHAAMLPKGAVVCRCELRACSYIPKDLDEEHAAHDWSTACECGHIRSAHRAGGKAICRVSTRWQQPGTPGADRVITNSFDGTIATCACPGYRRKFTEQERAFGDYTPGRYAWLLDKVECFTRPIPFAGLQGFFNVPDELIAQACGFSPPAVSTAPRGLFDPIPTGGKS